MLTLVGLSGFLLAGDGRSSHVILGKGTNLAHWLSQTKRNGEDRRPFITQKDIAYIAELGFDHVRLPIDEHQMWDDDGNRDEIAFEIMNDAIRWSLKHEMMVLIDLHILRSHHFHAVALRYPLDLHEGLFRSCALPRRDPEPG